ncbi:MAG: hypothetical protein L6Q63_00620 [Giesbergeria sp.]|nr:hypothetical protein [Giesbergeria sp.]
MLDVSQATSLLQSLGISSSVANKAVERSAQSAGTDAQAFLKILQQNLKELTASTPSSASAGAVRSQLSTGTSSASQAENATNAAATASTVKAPFGNFQEFKEWEKGLGDTFAKDYKAPDYVKTIALTLSGGDSDAFKRYMFFKNNPQYAVDYESIRDGNLSKFPTDGSTLIKSDLSKMDTETAVYYKKDPSQLQAAEGFNMDPTLLKKRMEGDTQGGNDPEWLTNHKWTATGVIESNNRAMYAQASFIGLDGKGADNYRLAKYDNATGRIIDFDGRSYDPITGEEA